MADRQASARPRTELLIPIPAGTKMQFCKGKKCGKAIYFAKHPRTGNMHPVSIDDGSAKAPTATTDGVGVSHYSNCSDADDFRTPRTAKGV